IRDFHVTGVQTCALPISANYVAGFGTEELHGCENAPGYFPVSASGQCIGDGAFYHNSRVKFRDVTDGLSNTLIVGERRTHEVLEIGRASCREGVYISWSA